jgi:myo-inositol-1(or 4)-monophosphatase
MSELSREGCILKGLCDSLASSVGSAICRMVGDPASGVMVEMGADGTPTKSIDRVAEDAVLFCLRLCADEGSIAGFKVLSEEIGEVLIGEEPECSLYLDPLDGTFNAVKGIPFYSLSVYLVRGGCRLGYVYDLARSIGYYAEAGRGAYVDAARPRRLRVSRTSNLKDFGISAYTIRPNTARIVRLGDVVRRIRTLGSTSLEMSLMGAGMLDAFVDLRGRLRVVDVAAGKLIVEEAGGVITDESGRPLHLDGDMWQRTELIGSNGLLHGEILELIGGGGN